MLSGLSAATNVADALIDYTKQLEADYRKEQDISMFIFAVRSFFCWHRAPELVTAPEDITRVRAVWISDNEEAYTKWLSSADDDPTDLRWAKWTFQAKNSILNEFLEAQRVELQDE